MAIKKKYLIIALVIIAFVGSIFAFYCTNLVMAAIANKGTPGFFGGLLLPISAIMLPIEFVLAAFFIVRHYLHPTHLKRMIKVYSITLLSLAGVGLLTVILSGALVYKNMAIAVPFGGGLIIFMLWHLATIAFGLFALLYLRKKVEYDDIYIHKTTPKYVFMTILISLLVFYSFNRFGAFLHSPFYCQYRTLDNTYPFYVLICLPMAMLVVIMLYIFGVFNKKGRATIGIFVSGITAALSIFILLQFISRSSKDQSFLAAISPAVPIERLMTFPIDTILNAITVVILAIYTVNHSVKFKRFKDKELGVFKVLEAKKKEEK